MVTRSYIQKNNIFADAFNYLIYNGRKKIQPDCLREVDVTELAVLPDHTMTGNGSVETEQRYRDALKSAVIMEDEKAAYVLLGVENQTDIHYAMPVRNMIYDALQYGKQVDRIAARNKKQKRKTGRTGETSPDLQRAEFLSGFGKKDKLLPVITLVIHFGAEEWDGPTSLREMFGETETSLTEFIQDYKIHLIDPARLTDEELKKFHTSLGDVLGCIKHSKSKEELKTYLVGNSMMALEIDAIQVLQTLTGMPVETEKGEEKMELCKALQEWSDEERSEGRQEVLTELVKEGCISIVEAARRASMSEEEFRRKMDEMIKEK